MTATRKRKRKSKSIPTGFDFTSRMRALCADMVARVPQLHHIDISHVAFSFSQARRRVSHGLYATLTPMRFENGAMTEVRRGHRYSVQRLFDEHGQEMLYILSFYLPRYMDVDIHEKLVTIFHELWHVSPSFDGDLRRHPGRCYAHTRSQKDYDGFAGRLADLWLSASPPEDLFAFLHMTFDELQNRHGRVFGMKITQPKLLPVD
ncbi:MAG: hypothetical protein IH991_24205 [Planctomycetes bacterium]|nr:hypothetical protein [Planctomycetota bacterium]